jgi:HEAT repeat protein
MKKIILIALVIISISVFSWLNYPSTSSVEVVYGKVTKPIKPVAQQEPIQKGTQANRPKPIEENTKLLPKKKTITNSNIEQNMLKEREALQIADTLLNNVFNNKTINFAAERKLLSYLKATNNEQIYQIIIEKLQNANPGNDNDDRLLEYGLSLLAAIDSSRSSELFYTFIAKDNWQGSSAIYTVRKSISRLSRNPAYTELVQQKFTQTTDKNPFIGELASAIAYHAKAEQIDYLISYVDGKLQNKSSAASRAMKKIQSEALVPHITSYISNDFTKNVQNTALDTLAHMGQYEAVSALITWSSSQHKDSAEQVKELFSIALSRSPSTYRAIEKELHYQSFASEELKQLIINLSNEGT